MNEIEEDMIEMIKPKVDISGWSEIRKEKLVIDYFLMSKRKWSHVKDVDVIIQAEMGSYYYLLKMNMETQNDERTKGERK